MVQKITACAFLYQSDTVCIAKRADTKTFLPWKYELPWGHIEFWETLEEGLQREMFEEFGVSIIVEEPFHAFTYIRDNNTVHSIEVDYFVRFENSQQVIKLNSEDHLEYRWIDAWEVKNFFNEDDEEYKAIMKWFEFLSKRRG